MGRVVRGMGATVLGDSSAMAVAVGVWWAIDGSDAALDVVLVVDVDVLVPQLAGQVWP